MFYRLPVELIRLIYEYDSTYHEVYAEVLQQIKQYHIYENSLFGEHKMYLIYDQNNRKSYITDSLDNPTWISISYRITRQDIRQMVSTHNMFYNRRAKLEYDVTSYEFTTNLEQSHEMHFLV